MATDDDDAATLRERVRELEQTVAQQQDTIEQLMPSRRAILAGGAGLVGGAALTGQASAQSAAGQVGTSSEPVDVEAASVNVQEGVSTPSAFVSGTLTASEVNTDSVNTDKQERTGDSPIVIGSVGHREDFSGPNADDRLDAAISAASDGDTIYLEDAEYSIDRTISKKLRLVGTLGEGVGTAVEGIWTVEALGTVISDIVIQSDQGGRVDLNAVRCAIVNTNGSDPSNINISADRCRVMSGDALDITFESGTSGGIADGLTNASVTDNGNNLVGTVT